LKSSKRTCPEYGCQEDTPNDLDADVVDVADEEAELEGQQPPPFSVDVSLSNEGLQGDHTTTFFFSCSTQFSLSFKRNIKKNLPEFVVLKAVFSSVAANL
jgi:hypothetical protein